MNAAQRRKSDRSRGRTLSDTLDMLASQLREHLEDAENGAPIPWLFDDWLTEYRRWHQSTRRRRDGQ